MRRSRSVTVNGSRVYFSRAHIDDYSTALVDVA